MFILYIKIFIFIMFISSSSVFSMAKAASASCNDVREVLR